MCQEGEKAKKLKEHMKRVPDSEKKGVKENGTEIEMKS